jgi:hypothetical protein
MRTLEIEDILKRDKRKMHLYMSSIMFKRECITFFEETFGRLDFDWVLRLVENRKVIEIEPCVKRYMNQKNLSLTEDYRRIDFYWTLLTLDQYGDRAIDGIKKTCGSRARYYYLMGEMKKARHYFWQSKLSLKTILYIITSYLPFLSNFVKKHFRVFG